MRARPGPIAALAAALAGCAASPGSAPEAPLPTLPSAPPAAPGCELAAGGALDRPGLVVAEASFSGGSGWPGLPRAGGGPPVCVGPTLFVLDADAVENAQPYPDPATGRPLLGLGLSPEAAAAFARITAERVGQPIAILDDGQLLTAPVVRAAITGGSVELTGFDTLERARELARRLTAR